MKVKLAQLNWRINRILTLFISIILVSCSSSKQIKVQKRKYRSGYYFSTNSEVNIDFQKTNQRNSEPLAEGKQSVSSNIDFKPIVHKKSITYQCNSATQLTLNITPETKINQSTTFSSNNYLNKKAIEKSRKNKETLKSLLFLFFGFLVVTGIELLFPHASALLSIVIAIAVVAILILLFRYFQNRKKPVR